MLRAARASVKDAMVPVPSVVRSTVASWQTTSSPSAVAWTSSSIAVAPAASACAMAKQRRRRRLPGPALVRVGDHPAFQPHGLLAHRPTVTAGLSDRTRRSGGEVGLRPRRLASTGVLDHLLVDVIGTIRAVLRPGAAPAPGRRGAVPGRRLPGRRVLGDLLQPARRGATAPGARRPLGRLADVEPDLLPQLVDRRAARRAARGRHRGRPARPAHGRGPRHREGDGRAAAERSRSATRWTWSARRPRSSRCRTDPDDGGTAGHAGRAGPPRPPTRARSASASTSSRTPRRSHPIFDGLTRWIASTLDHPGRPALHLPAPRGGRRLTRLSPRRALTLVLVALGVLLGRLRLVRARGAAGQPGPRAEPAHAPHVRCSTSTAGRVAGRAARQGRRAGALPVPLPGRVPARSPPPSSHCSATCAPPGCPTGSSSWRRRSTRAATAWPAWPPTRRSSAPTGTSGPGRPPRSRPSGSRSA